MLVDAQRRFSIVIVFCLLEFVGFGAWAAPGGLGALQEGGGRNPPPFWMALKHPEAAKTLRTDDFPNAPKTTKRKNALRLAKIVAAIPY
jgi:hypothetical protein